MMLTMGKEKRKELKDNNRKSNLDQKKIEFRCFNLLKFQVELPHDP